MTFQPCAKLAQHDKVHAMRIAIIEDNVELAHGIAYRLRDRGHAVDALHDGEEADRFLAQEGADLVVLDINLPGMSGLDILRALRRRGDGSWLDRMDSRVPVDQSGSSGWISGRSCSRMFMTAPALGRSGVRDRWCRALRAQAGRPERG